MADAEVEITAEKLLSLTQAAGIEGVEPVSCHEVMNTEIYLYTLFLYVYRIFSNKIWAQLYAKAMAGQNIHDLLTQVSTGGAAAGPAAAGPAAAAGEEAAVEEEKEEEKEESDEDMGMGLFD